MATFVLHGSINTWTHYGNVETSSRDCGHHLVICARCPWLRKGCPRLRVQYYEPWPHRQTPDLSATLRHCRGAGGYLHAESDTASAHSRQSVVANQGFPHPGSESQRQRRERPDWNLPACCRHPKCLWDSRPDTLFQHASAGMGPKVAGTASR